MAGPAVTDYTAATGVSIPVPAVMDVVFFSGFAFGGTPPPTTGQLWPRGNP